MNPSEMKIDKIKPNIDASSRDTYWASERVELSPRIVTC